MGGARTGCWDGEGAGRSVPGGHVECGRNGRKARALPARRDCQRLSPSPPLPGPEVGRGGTRPGLITRSLPVHYRFITGSLPVHSPPARPTALTAGRVEGMTSSRRAGSGLSPAGLRHFRCGAGRAVRGGGLSPGAVPVLWRFTAFFPVPSANLREMRWSAAG